MKPGVGEPASAYTGGDTWIFGFEVLTAFICMDGNKWILRSETLKKKKKYSRDFITGRNKEDQACNFTAILIIIDARYHDFNGFPVVTGTKNR
jgi:hypothetical protein